MSVPNTGEMPKHWKAAEGTDHSAPPAAWTPPPHPFLYAGKWKQTGIS